MRVRRQEGLANGALRSDRGCGSRGNVGGDRSAGAGRSCHHRGRSRAAGRADLSAGAPALRGGDICRCSGAARKERLIGAFERLCDGSSIDLGLRLLRCSGLGELHVASGAGTEVLHADSVMSDERSARNRRAVSGVDDAWVSCMRAASQALLKSQSVLAGRRIVVAGAGPLPIVVAAQILRAGGDVAALATLNSLGLPRPATARALERPRHRA